MKALNLVDTGISSEERMDLGKRELMVNAAQTLATLYLAEMQKPWVEVNPLEGVASGWVPVGFRASVERIAANDLPTFLMRRISQSIGGILIAEEGTITGDLDYGVLRARGYTGDKLLDAELQITPGCIIAYAWGGASIQYKGKQLEALRLGDIQFKYVPEDDNERKEIKEWLDNRQRQEDNVLPLIPGEDTFSTDV